MDGEIVHSILIDHFRRNLVGLERVHKHQRNVHPIHAVEIFHLKGDFTGKACVSNTFYGHVVCMYVCMYVCIYECMYVQYNLCMSICYKLI